MKLPKSAVPLTQVVSWESVRECRYCEVVESVGGRPGHLLMGRVPLEAGRSHTHTLPLSTSGHLLLYHTYNMRLCSPFTTVSDRSEAGCGPYTRQFCRCS